MPIRPLDELPAFELELQDRNPMHYVVVGAADFVLGRVKRLLVDTDRLEVVYAVVNTRLSTYRDDRGEDRLLPLDWAELVHMRRQVRLPHLSRVGFRQLPLYRADEPLPERGDFPAPSLEDPDLRDIA